MDSGWECSLEMADVGGNEGAGWDRQSCCLPLELRSSLSPQNSEGEGPSGLFKQGIWILFPKINASWIIEKDTPRRGNFLTR